MSELVNILSHLKAAETYGKEISSTLIGACVVNNIETGTEETTVTLVQKNKNRVLVCDEFGRPCGDPDAECCVFPSKDNRDWSTFDATPRFDIGELKPFDKVLRRSSRKEAWAIDFFSHYNDNLKCFVCHPYGWEECVPYNEETKHLLGTTAEAPEFYRTWKSDSN